MGCHSLLFRTLAPIAANVIRVKVHNLDFTSLIEFLQRRAQEQSCISNPRQKTLHIMLTLDVSYDPNKTGVIVWLRHCSQAAYEQKSILTSCQFRGPLLAVDYWYEHAVGSGEFDGVEGGIIMRC